MTYLSEIRICTMCLPSQWQPAFKAVMDAENDTDIATAAIEKLAHAAANRTGLKIRIPTHPVVPQLDSLESDVTQSILDLQARNCIFGTPPTLDEFLEPKEEAETRDSAAADIFDGPRGDKAIVAEVAREMAEKNNKVIEVDSDDEDEPGGPDVSHAEMIDLCGKPTEACLQHGDASSDLPLSLLIHLRHFRVCLRREELLHAGQTTLDAFLTYPSHQSLDPHTTSCDCHLCHSV